MANLVFDRGSSFMPTEAWFSYAGAYNGAMYAVVIPAGYPTRYAMLKSSDAGATWAEVDAANAPVCDSYYALNTLLQDGKVYVAGARAASGNDEFGWRSDYYTLTQFDCATPEGAPDAWGTPQDVARRCLSDYWGGHDAENWQPRIGLALSGSEFRFTYSFRRWNTSTYSWEKPRGCWASRSGGVWSIDNFMTPVAASNWEKALGTVYRSGAWRNLVLGDNNTFGALYYAAVDATEVANIWDPWDDGISGSIGIVSFPFLTSDGKCAFMYRASNTNVSLATESSGVWSTETIGSSSTPLVDSFITTVCLELTSGQTLGLIYDYGDAAARGVDRVMCETFTAAATGLHAFWQSAGAIVYSFKSGGAWSAPATLVSAPATGGVHCINAVLAATSQFAGNRYRCWVD